MKKGLLAVIIGLVLALAVGGYFVMNRQASAPQTPTSNSSQTEVSTSGSASQRSSLRSLMGLGTSQMCTFQDAEANNAGTVYIANGKMRGDFESTVNGTVTNSHMYSDGTSTYMWFDGGQDGFKMSLAQANQAQQGSEQQKNVDVDKQVDYDCKPWTADAGILTYPTDITFSDYGAMTAPTGAGTTGNDTTVATDKETQCATCDNLPGDAAAQCRQALGC